MNQENLMNLSFPDLVIVNTTLITLDIDGYRTMEHLDFPSVCQAL